MQHHVKRNIDLAADLDELIGEAISRGDYSSASEVIDEALRVWGERRENFGYSLSELRALVNEGVESGPGKFSSLDEIKTEARRRLKSQQDAR